MSDTACDRDITNTHETFIGLIRVAVEGEDASIERLAMCVMEEKRSAPQSLRGLVEALAAMGSEEALAAAARLRMAMGLNMAALAQCAGILYLENGKVVDVW